MTERTTELSRRGFLAGLGGVLSLAVVGCGGTGTAARVRHADQAGELAANMYITVMPDGRIAVAVNKAEIGQGVTTGFATLAADELAVPIEHIDVHLADSHPEYRTSYNMHQTGGSTSTKEAFDAIRTAAAAAREMLIGAAAATWGVAARDCTVAAGVVTHAGTKRELGYGELTRQAARRDVPDKPRLNKRSEFTAIGKTDRRVDLRAKVDGSAVFGTDVQVPDLVHAYVIHGPRFGAAATSVKAEAAKQRPGVIDVFAFPGGVAIVANKYWQALAAARDVEVTWSHGDTVGLDTEQLRVAMRSYKQDGAPTREDGNAERALAEARTKIEAIYEAPYLAHAPLEPQNCTVKITGKRAEVWAPCQTPTLVQSFVADVIGGERDDVLVHTTLAGGGFGRRVNADFAYQAAHIAKHVGRTVKMIWSRESDMTQAFYRPQYTTSMQGAVEAGKVTALVAHGVSQSIALSSEPFFDAFLPGIPGPLKHVVVESMLAMFATNALPDIFATEGLRDTPYLIPNLRVDYTPVRTKLPVATWRSVGHSFNGFAMESFIDELARAANADPLAFRKQMVKPGSSQMRVLDAIGELSGWGTPAPGNRARGLARHHAFDTEVAEVAEVEIVDNRIKVRKVYCVVDCGIAVNPSIVRAQMEGAIIYGLSAALDQEITLVDGVVQQSNFNDFPALRMFEAPEIVVQIIDSDEHPTGVGEPGLPPIAAAVANAVHALTKVRLRRLPLQRAWNERGGAS
ncbi:MAG TPA: molybdopterin cofactor-binding domain-containing protein [Kofleriaceae bacterium]|jgi:CO/xanthine dehydrogenase Mo-binding subunit|nr:molybdopterin cofactor-binding domain-containing protein [Kofleriaceae bacterium]